MALSERNIILVVFGLLSLMLLAYLSLDFLHTVWNYEICTKTANGSVFECWACDGIDNCETPYRQFCSDRSATETRYSIRKYFNESSDAERKLRKKKLMPRDPDTKEYIIKERNNFKCFSLLADYRDIITKESIEIIHLKGCVYGEWSYRHMLKELSYLNETRDYELDSIASLRYICSDNLCNKEWDMDWIHKPHARRFFESPRPVSGARANPQGLFELLN